MKIHLSIYRRLCFLVLAALLLLCAFPASATVNVIGYWRMGENDPGAANGSPVISSIDSIAGNNLVFATNSTYSADVTPIAVTRVNSSLSVNLTNQSYALAGTIVTNATDHFGIEAWIKPMMVNGTAQVIVYNGNTGTSGWGIFLDANNNYSGLFGGAAIITGTPAQPGVWVDVALVRNSPNTVLYINGVAVATNSISSPAVPVGGFAIGTVPQNPTGEFFTGLVDEVRVFAFAAGQFTTNDLLANAGLPSARATAASPLTATSSTLNGYVFPNGAPTTAWFQWGTTPNYDQTTAPTIMPASNNSSPISSVITGLTMGTTYHYALIVSNAVGTNLSQDSMFTVGGLATTATGLPNVQDGSAAWGDYDNDGRLDILLSGFTTNGAITQIWHNNGDGTFSNINAGLDIIYSGSAAWGDYDNDGKLDLLISGNQTTEVWHNNGDGTFSLNTNANLTPLVDSSVAWGDYDNDGRPDILIAGNTSIGIFRDSMSVTEVWHNNGDGTFSNIHANITPVLFGSATWGDFDNDGRLDILITGNTVTQVWRNNGNGTFANINAGLPGLRFSFAAWGDYNNDGNLDILLSGSSSTLGNITQVWHNNGNGTFSLNTNANLTGVFAGSVAWGDYDNDGRLDILLSGDSTSGPGGPYFTEVWHNNGDGTFSNLIGDLPNSTPSFVTWADYDNDGRLDILLAANYQVTTRLTQLWKNQTLQPNTPPQAPSGLFAQTAGTNIIFHWSPASDFQTPTAGLSYNLRIGSSPGALNIVAPLSANNGFVKVPQSGNAQASLSKSFFASLGTHYYWSVQAVDTSFAGSPFALEQSFEILPVLAPVGAPNPVFGDANGDGTVDGAEVITVLSHLTTNGTIGPDALNLALRNYFAAYPLVMSNVDGLGSSKILFTLPNSPDPNLSVQSSTDLVNWDTLGPVNYGFIDTNGVTNPHRFYRLSYP